MSLTHVVALSGGKDSTCLALRLRELHPETDYQFVCTPTGNELPEMTAHWQKLEELLGAPIRRITNGTLESWMEHWNALPNWRQRWCTRVLKIEPMIAFLLRHQPAVQYVGLRADESEETRQGLVSDYAGVETRFPLREWGWGLKEVRGYLAARGVTVPERTDCAWCYGQRLAEWYRLHFAHPEIYAAGVAWEERTGHTFRSPGRDTKPAPLAALAEIAPLELARLEERARRRRAARSQLALPVLGQDEDFDEDEVQGACRVCRL